jgi:hypothetical protein
MLTGLIGWSGNPLLLPFALLFPAPWASAPSRVVAGLVSAAYFLAASRGLPKGAMVFFGSQLAIALALWIAASLLFVAVHSVLWTSRRGWISALRYLAAAILMSAPPFGITGWAGPITAAGILFPGWGWMGLAATAILLGLMTTRKAKIAAPIIAGLAVWSAAVWTLPILPDGWVGINTRFRFDQAGQYAGFAQQQETIALVRKAATEGARVIVLPESAVGIWTPTVAGLWQDALRGMSVTVIAGAEKLDPTGYDSIMAELTAQGSKILYRERMPVPVSMWQPWKRLSGGDEGAHAYFFANPVVAVDGNRAAPLICYEQLLVWPVLQSMLYNPQIIIATGNDWWTGGSNINSIQHASAIAWAKLFNLPLVMAFNE